MNELLAQDIFSLPVIKVAVHSLQKKGMMDKYELMFKKVFEKYPEWRDEVENEVLSSPEKNNSKQNAA